jgi:hypothetical protein
VSLPIDLSFSLLPHLLLSSSTSRSSACMAARSCQMPLAATPTHQAASASSASATYGSQQSSAAPPQAAPSALNMQPHSRPLQHPARCCFGTA